MSDYFEEPIIGDVIHSADWKVQRRGEVVEVTQGDRLRFRVQIWDIGREPFITQWFNDPAPAIDFMDRVRDQNQGTD